MVSSLSGFATIFGHLTHDYDLPRICLYEANGGLHTRLDVLLLEILHLWVAFQVCLIYLQMISSFVNYYVYAIDE